MTNKEIQTIVNELKRGEKRLEFIIKEKFPSLDIISVKKELHSLYGVEVVNSWSGIESNPKSDIILKNKLIDELYFLEKKVEFIKKQIESL